ncbi:MAG: alpha/beta hydrolase [Marinibacterium sp.]|nr:alpha/beta hydrolase [Marinibacterium sp.]
MTDMDDAYANAAHIPGSMDYPARWAAEAAAFRDGLGARCERDLPYGDGARERFDLFHPDGVAQGVLIFVHGGYWRMFDPSSWSHLAAGALARGWAVAMPGYDLCPDASIAGITRQIARAVQVVAARQAGPITLAGHSAGGHLVARMLDPKLLGPDVALRIRRVLPISPLSDLRPLMQTAMNADFRLDAAMAEDESPVFMSIRHAAPVTVWVGGDERPAFLDQARWLADAWDSALVVAPGRHHFDVIAPLTDASSDMVALLTPD